MHLQVKVLSSSFLIKEIGHYFTVSKLEGNNYKKAMSLMIVDYENSKIRMYALDGRNDDKKSKQLVKV